MAQLISGKALAAEVKQRVAQGVAALRAQGHPVCLRVFLVGDDPASATYVAGKERDCAECGITSQVVRLPADTPQQQLVAQVRAASEAAVIAAIAPHKDVDGFTPVNAGVQGTKHGWPSSMRPAFTGVKPSTSLCGAMAAITAASLMCAGSGSCTSTPLTALSALAACTLATSCACGVSAGRRTTCEVMPHSAQSRSLPAT